MRGTVVKEILPTTPVVDAQKNCRDCRRPIFNSDEQKLFARANKQWNKCECTTDPAWRARSAIVKWQVDREIRTLRPGSRKRGLRNAQRDLMRAALRRAAELAYVLNHFNSLIDFIKHA